jgi:hypothetical protein
MGNIIGTKRGCGTPISEVMMLIDFKVDEEELRNSLDDDITKEEFNIAYTSVMFIMPIRIQVNGIELFELNGDPWCEAPLLSIASDGLFYVKALKHSGKEEFRIIEGPGEIEFTMIDKTSVKLDFYDGAKHTVTVVKYDELLEAFEKFADKVRKFLRERAPQINENSYWGPWLRGECD